MGRHLPAIQGGLDVPTARERRLYDLTLKIARDSDCSDRHGSLVVKGRRIIAVATNRLVTHPISEKWLKSTVHAEQRALIRAGSKAKRATIYCARDHANLISMPCTMCFSLLQEAGVSRVVFYYQDKLVAYNVNA